MLQRNKKKFLLVSYSMLTTIAIVCAAVALMPKGYSETTGESNEAWNHYSEKMPTKSAGIKEYWVSCDSHTYQFSAPTEGVVQDVTGWDTSEFAVDDDRYTYQCTTKIANSAVAGTSAATAPNAPAQGFDYVEGKSFTATGFQGFNVDISGYDYVNFALYHNLDCGYLLLFGGNSAQSDEQEVAISKDANIVLWKDTWYYITLERNGSGQWDAFVGSHRAPKRYANGVKMDNQSKNATNLKDIVGVWTWDAIKAEDMIYSTDVYGVEKEHHYSWDSNKLSPIGTCPVCGATTSERPMSTIDFRTNKYGAKLMNEGASSDVSNWGDGYNGGTKLNAYGATSLAYAYYGWGVFGMYLPRIDFTKYAEVSFKLSNTMIYGKDGPNADPSSPSGNPAGFRIGFDVALPLNNDTNFASTWDGAEISNGKLTFTATSEKVIVTISSFGYLISKTYEITDSDIINGNSSVVIYYGSYLNDSTSYALLLSDLEMVALSGFQQAEESQIADASIKEVYLEKQVRRLEQQDSWKFDADYEAQGSKERGHAEYYKLGSRDFIHFSAHYESSDAQHYNYNSSWSEWRFNHVMTKLSAVTFTYLYVDSNTELANDGTDNNVHTMSQWYGAAYQARNMDLIPDGQLHTITVTGDTYDINFFVMKIYHFTGDIYISNIQYEVEAYKAVDASEITDASIKEVYLEKQVRRVEQQDSWKFDDDYVAQGEKERGHADYYKIGNKQAIHFSAHYESSDAQHYNYNSSWSEWRFQHQQAGVTSVTFTYLYTDSNIEVANDGTNNDVHTMAQWYGAAYQARNMDLVADGAWHTITVTGEAYDINFFVMKIYHFTGDIYISNIIYA